MPEPHAAAGLTPVSPDDALEQLAEYWGFDGSFPIKVSDGAVFWVPTMGAMDDDQLARYQELQHSLRGFDHEEVEVRNPITNDVIINPKTGAPLVNRVIIQPHQKDGVLVKPPYEVRLCVALWGKQGYERYKAGGGRAALVPLIWRRMEREFDRRLAEDPKSGRGAVGDTPVRDSD